MCLQQHALKWICTSSASNTLRFIPLTEDEGFNGVCAVLQVLHLVVATAEGHDVVGIGKVQAHGRGLQPEPLGIPVEVGQKSRQFRN